MDKNSFSYTDHVHAIYFSLFYLMKFNIFQYCIDAEQKCNWYQNFVFDVCIGFSSPSVLVLRFFILVHRNIDSLQF